MAAGTPAPAPDRAGPFALEAVGLEFGYGRGAPVLSGVDLSVRPGEVVGLIGPNGAGKSTLVGLLSGVLKPRAGVVRVLGDPIGALSAPERARRIAVTPQEPKVAFPFTVLEIALMGRSPRLGRWALEGATDVAKARAALARVRLEALADRRFHELSGGERQRVMIAKALAQEPRALLMDEPTAFLDLRYQVEVYELVVALAREQGIAALMASHDVNLAGVYCHRVAALWQGRIVADGAPLEVYTPELFAQIYGVVAKVIEHPERPGAPLVLPLRARPDSNRPDSNRPDSNREAPP